MVKLGICDDCFKYGPSPAAGGFNEHNRINDINRVVQKIIVTTSFDIPNRKIEHIIDIVASEAALGMNIFRDIANNWRDFVGGRANSAQMSLKDARLACLEGLKREAAAIGADAVISVDLDYNELSTGGSGGILFVAASGTAVKLTPLDAD
jgi:uncharacterized protein YbjQ (UPF0145 family)